MRYKYDDNVCHTMFNTVFNIKPTKKIQGEIHNGKYFMYNQCITIRKHYKLLK